MHLYVFKPLFPQFKKQKGLWGLRYNIAGSLPGFNMGAPGQPVLIPKYRQGIPSSTAKITKTTNNNNNK